MGKSNRFAIHSLFSLQCRQGLEKLQPFTYPCMLGCVCLCMSVSACAHVYTCIGRALEQFTTAGVLMNEGIRIADVKHKARK